MPVATSSKMNCCHVSLSKYFFSWHRCVLIYRSEWFEGCVWQSGWHFIHLLVGKMGRPLRSIPWSPREYRDNGATLRGRHSHWFEWWVDPVTFLIDVPSFLMFSVVNIHPNSFLGVVGFHEDFPIEKLCLSRDGNLLASISHDQSIKFWNIGRSHSSLSFHPSYVE